MKKREITEFLTGIDLEQQENLSPDILNSIFNPRLVDTPANRPESNFIDLMNWTESNFSSFLKKTTGKLNKFVHNKIIIDGQFLQFAKENSIKVDCLFKDSIISWKTENNFEKYFAQGVFLIKHKKLEFIHAALYHKGHQNEDEVSFFILVDNESFQDYLDLRNSFDLWLQKRDRSNLYIQVIGGDNIPYTKDHVWDDLVFPDSIKNDIQKTVEGFLNSRQFYLDNKIPWKRGVLLFGTPGCGKTSLIRTIISVYNFKPITVASGANDEIMKEAFSYAEEQSPSLLYFEDLDSLLSSGSVNPATFLNLMDGISAKNGIFVMATANDIRRLPPNITDRPSRFDRKFEIPVPNLEMTEVYLRKWFGKIISNKKYDEICKTCTKFSFSYVHLKELYISSMFGAIADNRKQPNLSDIDSALTTLIKDKDLLKRGNTINTEKYLK